MLVCLLFLNEKLTGTNLSFEYPEILSMHVIKKKYILLRPSFYSRERERGVGGGGGEGCGGFLGLFRKITGERK